MLSRFALCLASSISLLGSTFAAEIKVLAPNAAKDSVLEAVATFEKTTGHKVVVAWTGTEAITKRVADGEVVDVVVNAAQNIDRQSKDGKLVATTRTDFARSGIAAAVPASAAKVDISTAESLKAALLSARSVVVSSGTSGRHMVELFAKLAVSEQLKAKTKQPPSGVSADPILTHPADSILTRGWMPTA